MSIDVNWLDETQTCLLVKFMGDWTFDDYQQMASNSDMLSCDVTHPFVTIFDYTLSAEVSPALVSSCLRIQRTTHAHHAGVVVVQPDESMIGLARIFIDLLKLDLAFVQKLDDAVAKADELLQTHSLTVEPS